MVTDLCCNNEKSQIFYILKNSVNRYIHWQVQLLWSNTLRTYFFIVNNA
jgi:hypothetical protein